MKRTTMTSEYAITASEPFDCPWCNKAHKGCPSCGAETGCTDQYRPEDYAEVLAFCDCDSQEVDGAEFITISEADARGEEYYDDE